VEGEGVGAFPFFSSFFSPFLLLLDIGASTKSEMGKGWTTFFFFFFFFPTPLSLFLPAADLLRAAQEKRGMLPLPSLSFFFRPLATLGSDRKEAEKGESSPSPSFFFSYPSLLKRFWRPRWRAARFLVMFSSFFFPSPSFLSSPNSCVGTYGHLGSTA